MKIQGKPISCKKITTLVNALLVLVFLSIGIILLLWSNDIEFWKERETLRCFLRDLGSTLFVSVTLLCVWELALRRAFLNEFLDKVNLSQQINRAGLKQLVYYPKDINWDELFLKAKEIDLLLAYGKTWRASNKYNLEKFIEQSDSHLRIVMPNPTLDHLLQEMTERFSQKTYDELQSKIQTAENDFVCLSEEEFANGRIKLWRMNIAPVFSMYRSDDTIIISFYSHKKMVGVPHLIVDRGGQVFGFAMSQFSMIIDPEFGRAELFFDNRKTSNKSILAPIKA
jgi:hypothetical protein